MALVTEGAAQVADALRQRILRDGEPRSGTRLLRAVRLLERASGRQLWGERLDCVGDDVLAVQATLARRIIGRLIANVEDSVLQHVPSIHSDSSAFKHLVRGVALLRNYGEGVNERARQEFLRALAIDPDYGLAHAYLALSETIIAGYGRAERSILESAHKRATTAVARVPEEARCHRILGINPAFPSELRCRRANSHTGART